MFSLSRSTTRLAQGLALVVAAGALSAAAPSGANAVGEPTANKPSHRAGATRHRIAGNPDGQAHLEKWQGLCSVPGATGNFQPFDFGYGNGQPLPYGPLSVAWIPNGADAAVALRAFTRTPAKVDRFDVQVYHPEPSVEGFVSVSYVPDRNVDAEWLGKATFTDSTSGWHAVDGTGVTFEWTHLVAGTTRDGQTTPPSTVRGLAKRLGTSRDEAHMGFAFGCDQKQTFVDGLRLGSTKFGWDVYDMIGRPSSVTLRTARFARTCQLSAPRYPDKLRYLGTIEGLKRFAIWRLDERGRLLQRVTRFKTVRDGRFHGKVDISRNSVLVAYAPNTDTTAPALSKAVRIFARPAVDFSPGAPTAVRGRGLDVSGRITANERVRYTALATHWTGSRWTPYRAVDKGRTNYKGSFHVKAPTGTLGYSRISILTKGTKRVHAALSRTAVTYRVNAPKQSAPAPSSGNAGPPTSSSSAPPPPPAPTPVQPGGGSDVPAPTPEPGRVVVQRNQAGYGPCGWTPPTRRP